MPPTPRHPLEVDGDLDRRVREIIYIEIHGILGWPRTGADRALQGTGMGVEDIAAEAYAAVRMYDPDQLQRSWESLARSIAHRKTVQALRDAGKGLRGTPYRPELRLISGDAEITDSDGETRTVLEAIATDTDEFENETIDKINAFDLYKLASDIFDERELTIYVSIAHEGRYFTDVAEMLGLTGARVGQIFNKLIDRLEQHPDNPFRDDD